MLKIIDKVCTGKTKKLMQAAEANNYTIVCYNPQGMKQKAYNYGITGVDFISYHDFIYNGCDRPYYIDDLDRFVETIYEGFAGYTLTVED